ncbi:MAG: pantetheine-phosphate adenylyltransferase [Prevotella sp.]|nr:pantetheine-phosphate adenylyltransferase [Prevotella sp.]MDY5289665.1 pantetheine-phosphate adenylyltransferase [Prevotella sp.]
MKKGIFTGSFDPFTIGHLDIVKRALPLFDELTICIGFNELKHYDEPVEERMEKIRKVMQNEPKVKVDSWSGLTVDYCTRHDIHYIIKGVRSVKDFEYERDQAEMNRHLSGVETIFLFSDPRYSAVSSSLVKLLKSYGRDVSEFLPPVTD